MTGQEHVIEQFGLTKLLRHVLGDDFRQDSYFENIPNFDGLWKYVVCKVAWTESAVLVLFCFGWERGVKEGLFPCSVVPLLF